MRKSEFQEFLVNLREARYGAKSDNPSMIFAQVGQVAPTHGTGCHFSMDEPLLDDPSLQALDVEDAPALSMAFSLSSRSGSAEVGHRL